MAFKYNIRWLGLESLFRRRIAQVREWWHRPATGRDRFLGAFVGAFGGFWVGALARLALGNVPVSFSILVDYALVGAALGLLLGIVFPKSVLLIGFPFMSFGGTA